MPIGSRFVPEPSSQGAQLATRMLKFFGPSAHIWREDAGYCRSDELCGKQRFRDELHKEIWFGTRIWRLTLAYTSTSRSFGASFLAPVGSVERAKLGLGFEAFEQIFACFFRSFSFWLQQSGLLIYLIVPKMFLSYLILYHLTPKNMAVPTKPTNSALCEPSPPGLPTRSKLAMRSKTPGIAMGSLRKPSVKLGLDHRLIT